MIKHIQCFCSYIVAFISQISDDEFQGAASVFPANTPHTKEAYYYRKVFESFYEGNAHWVPYYWMPKWSDTNDPSPRTLSYYKQ